jgi:hypothetical protein
VGITGVRSVERPHLHFGVRRAGSRHAYVDPLTLLAPPAAPSPRTPDPVALPGPRAAPVPGRRAAPTPVPPRPSPAPAPRGLPVTAARPRAREVASAPAAEAHAAAPPQADAPRQRHLGAAPPALKLPAGEPLAPAAPAAPRPDDGVDAGRLLGCAGLLAAALALSGRRPRRAASARAPNAILSRLVPRPRE